jgi:replicative superfamily II helicase
MLVQDLVSYQVVPVLVSALKAAGFAQLLPLQELAMSRCFAPEPGTDEVADLGPQGLSRPEARRGRDVLAGPSASGKSVLAALWVVHQAHSGRRVLYLHPSPAQADAAHAQLGSIFGGVGLRLRRAGQGGLPDLLGQATQALTLDVLTVAASELLPLLVAMPGLLTEFQALCCDGAELLCDEQLGPQLELALTLLTPTPKPGQEALRLLVCSEVVAGLPQLATRLLAQLHVDERRPVELRWGVLCDGKFSFRSSRQALAPGEVAEVREEELYKPQKKPPGTQTSALAQVLRELTERGEQTLVLAPDRARAQVLADQAAAALRPLGGQARRGGARLLAGLATQDHQGLAALAQTPEGTQRARLQELLPCGVAFLDEGLLPSQQALVLQALAAGEVQVLCLPVAMAVTLAQRLQLDCKNVIVAEPWRWQESSKGLSGVRAELTSLELLRIGGLVARRRQTTLGAGRVMVQAFCRLEQETLWRGLLQAPPPQLQSRLRGVPLVDVALTLVAARVACTELALEQWLQSSWLAPVAGSDVGTGAATLHSMTLAMREAVSLLVEQGLLQRSETAQLRVTMLGQAAALQGLPVRTTLLWRRWVEAASGVCWQPLEALLTVMLSHSGEQVRVPLRLSELETGSYVKQLAQRAGEEGSAQRPLLQWLLGQGEALGLSQLRAVKKALLLTDWQDGGTLLALEGRYQVPAGVVWTAAGQAAQLLGALAAVGAACGLTAEGLQRLERMAATLRRPVVGTLASAGGLGVADASVSGRGAASVDLARAVFAIRAGLLAQRSAAAALPPEPTVAEHIAVPL